MGAVLPDFGGYRRIVQAPGSVSIFYDTGQGQGWQRVIPVDGSPHLPSSIRQRFGDSRGRWEGDTLVVDVTNFSPKFSYQAARENLHLVERFTRVDANTIEYTRHDRGSDDLDETVDGEAGTGPSRTSRRTGSTTSRAATKATTGCRRMLLGTRTEERAFAAGEGPDPATKDTATDFGNEGGVDALTGAGGSRSSRTEEATWRKTIAIAVALGRRRRRRSTAGGH